MLATARGVTATRGVPATAPITLTSASPYQGGISFVLPSGDTTSTFTFTPLANPQGYPISMDIQIGGTVRAVADTFSDYLGVSFTINYSGTNYTGLIADDIVIPTAA